MLVMGCGVMIWAARLGDWPQHKQSVQPDEQA